MKKWLWIIGITLLIFASGIGAYLAVSYKNLETYTFDEGTQLLTNSKGTTYRNLQEQFMNYEAIKPGKQIGKFGSSGSVYEIKGQENHDWVYVDDGSEMNIQEVRIREGVEAIPLEKLKPTKVEIVPNKGFQKSMGATVNQGIINEIMMTLMNGKEKFLKKVDGDINSIWLEDPRMKGIAYVQDVLVTNDYKHVYVADVNMNLWYEVTGPAKKWILDLK